MCTLTFKKTGKNTPKESTTRHRTSAPFFKSCIYYWLGAKKRKKSTKNSPKKWSIPNTFPGSRLRINGVQPSLSVSSLPLFQSDNVTAPIPLFLSNQESPLLDSNYYWVDSEHLPPVNAFCLIYKKAHLEDFVRSVQMGGGALIMFNIHSSPQHLK